MGFYSWLEQNWFTFLQSLGIIGGLLFTAISLQVDAKVRRVGNLITITQHHREIWTHIFTRPELVRVLDISADLNTKKVSTEEEWFVRLLILHLGSVYHAIKHGMFLKPQGLDADVRTFFSCPIPKAVWEKVRLFQDRDFVKFVEGRCR
jgi:hypothetical protein